MKLTVVEITEAKAGRRTIKMVSAQSVKTPFGVMEKKKTYYARVNENEAMASVDEEVNVDLDMFDIDSHPWLTPEGELPKDSDGNELHDGNGKPIMLDWLRLKTA